MTQEIAEIPIPKVELPVEYGLGTITANIAGAISVGTSIPWDSLDSNGVSIEKGDLDGNQRYSNIKIKGGVTYKLTGSLILHDASLIESLILYRWFNVTENEYIGVSGGLVWSSATQESSGSSPAISYIYSDEGVEVALRYESTSANNPDRIYKGSSFNIETFQNMTI